MLTYVVPAIVIVIAGMIAEYLRLKRNYREWQKTVVEVLDRLNGSNIPAEHYAEILMDLNAKLRRLSEELERHPFHSP